MLLRRAISLLDFQTGINTAAHAVVMMEQLIAHRTVIVDPFSTLQDLNGKVTLSSKVHDVLTFLTRLFKMRW